MKIAGRERTKCRSTQPKVMRPGFGPGGALAARALVCAAMTFPCVARSSTNHLQTAIDLIKQGDLETAEKEARFALNSPEERAPAWGILGTIRVQQKKYDEGVKFLRKAITLNPRLVGARVTLGGAYVLQGKKDSAREMFTEALRLDPANFNARLDLAQLESAAGNYRASLEAAKPIASSLRRSPEGLVLLATDYSGLQQKDSLEGLVPEWNAVADSPPELTATFAALLIKDGLGREGVEILEKAKSTSPRSFDLSFALGRGYASMKDLDRASENYEAALRLNEYSAPCLTEIARIAKHQANTEKALAYLIKAKRLEPENPEILFEFGEVCLERDLVDDAISALEKAVKLRPDNDSYRFVLASAHVAKKQYGDARSLLERLLDEHPDDPVLNYSLGAVLFLESNFSEAEGYMKRSIQLRPEQVAAYYYLGLISERRGDEDRALVVFRDLVRRHPAHAPTHEALGTLLLKKKDYPQAQQALEKAILLDPNLVEAHYQLGRLLGRIGKSEESNQQIEIARKLESERRAKNELRLRILTPQ